ncbi:MAG: nucleoside triphosphate pyrophosphohydrolase [Anaerolineae bacterium]|nr:nucleoside triphosphate pyrophosphohydrolase [Anaerolineae bacterium]
MPPELIVVGLGPGDPDLWTTAAHRALTATGDVWLRDLATPSAAHLPATARRHALPADDEDAASTLLALARRGDTVVYATPGHPAIDDPLWAALRRRANAASPVTLRLIPGLGLAAAALTAVMPDTSGGDYQVVAAATLAGRASPRLDVDTLAVVTGLRAEQLAGVAHALANVYPADHGLTLVTGLDTPIPTVAPTTLAALAGASVPGESALVVAPLAQPGAVTSLEEVMATLLSPDGCPWDREQTHASLRPYLLEETYEVLAALDAGDIVKLPEELGDLLLQIAFHSQIATRDGEFQLADVVRSITAKLIRRHPHVFGEVSVADADEVTRNWEKLKAVERAEAGQRATDPFAGIALALPALSRAQEMQRRATRFGFHWPDRAAAWARFEATLAEWRTAATGEARAHAFGDALFALVTVAQVDGLDAESALREANHRFAARFARWQAESLETGD